MYFDNWPDFLAMGRHGAYVWSAYGITFVVLAANLIHPILRKKRIISDLVRQLRREEALKSE